MDAWTAYVFTVGVVAGALVARILAQYRVRIER